MDYWQAKNILRRQAAGTQTYAPDVLAEAEQVMQDTMGPDGLTRFGRELDGIQRRHKEDSR